MEDGVLGGIGSFLGKSRAIAYFPPRAPSRTSFLLLRLLPVESSDSRNLPCVCYNWLLSPETGSIKSVDPTPPLRVRGGSERIPPQMTSRVKGHVTLKLLRCPDAAPLSLSVLPSIKPIEAAAISASAVNISEEEMVILRQPWLILPCKKS